MWRRVTRALEASRRNGRGASASAASAAVAWAFGAGLGCSKSDGAPPAGRAEPSSASRLASATAFDLVPAADGALLAWAQDEGAQSEGATIRWRRFDARGRPSAAAGASLPAGPGVRDLAAAETEAGAALAWVEGARAGSTVRAGWVDPGGAARAFHLGPGGGPVGSRGGLSLAPQGERALLFARAAEAPCDGSGPAPCAAFRFFLVAAGGARPSGVPLVVPSPCDEQAAQLVTAPGRGAGGSEALGRFDYAVCSRATGRAGLTVFSIQPSPAYAMAEDAFAGCTPLGAGRFAGEGGFVAACGSSRRLASAPGGGESLIVRSLDRRGLVCRNGAAQLAFGSGWLSLNEPLGRLELLLDEDLAPTGARAAWAGAALLVARADDAAKLRVSTYSCRGDVLVESAESVDAGALKEAL